MNIAAYCRVSTDKTDQLNSLETQKKFFAEYTKRTGDTLVKLYADEGLSGTKIKNRKQFLKMMSDAELGLFDMVVVKDISRFARNTVDLLQNIRKLKALGIETQFLTANMTSMGNSEFVLTIFGALAQEESANTSKRVKFGKKVNAEKGRVPNLVYGYDKTCGDYFNLKINEEEAPIVKEIFTKYTQELCGTTKIAMELNARGLKTKRGCAWTSKAVVRILSNELYIGKIINGKQEVKDFLTGKRIDRDSADWFVTAKPELKIIDEELFKSAQKLIKERGQAFKLDNARHSNRYIFSTLIRCKDCGWSFRRIERTFKNTYVRWACSCRNGRGVKSCINSIVIDEKELLKVIAEYFSDILADQKNVIKYVVEEFERRYRAKDENITRRKQLSSELEKIKKSREKYMNMYTDELISREELKEKMEGSKDRMEKVEKKLKVVSAYLSRHEQLGAVLKKTFRSISDIVDVSEMTNAQMKKIVDYIEVDHEGNVDIHLKLLTDLGLDCVVPVTDGNTQRRYRATSCHRCKTV